MKLFSYRKLLIVIFISHLLSSGVAGQTFNSLLVRYQSHQYSELRSEIEKLDPVQLRNDPGLQFFKALVKTNGEEAKADFEDLYKTQTGMVRTLAAEKLMEYYYARGYYITASEFQKFLLKSEPVAPEITNKHVPESPENKGNEPSGESYHIQVGAFGNSENARQLRDMLATQNIQCSIQERMIGGSRLHLVWIKGKSTLDETIEYANAIKEKYDLNFRIIKE